MKVSRLADASNRAAELDGDRWGVAGVAFSGDASPLVLALPALWRAADDAPPVREPHGTSHARNSCDTADMVWVPYACALAVAIGGSAGYARKKSYASVRARSPRNLAEFACHAHIRERRE